MRFVKCPPCLGKKKQGAYTDRAAQPRQTRGDWTGEEGATSLTTRAGSWIQKTGELFGSRLLLCPILRMSIGWAAGNRPDLSCGTWIIPIWKLAAIFCPFTRLPQSPALHLVLELRDQQLILFEGMRRLLMLEKCTFYPKRQRMNPKHPCNRCASSSLWFPSAGREPAPTMLIHTPHDLDAAAREQTAGRMLGAICVGCTVLKEIFYFKCRREVFIYPRLMSACSHGWRCLMHQITTHGMASPLLATGTVFMAAIEWLHHGAALHQKFEWHFFSNLD